MELYAFPHPQLAGIKGMTLRDYFAAAALQGLMANKLITDVDDFLTKWDWQTEAAYLAADQMLAQREQS